MGARLGTGKFVGTTRGLCRMLVALGVDSFEPINAQTVIIDAQRLCANGWLAR